jgi:hypothetical protein
MSPIGCTSGLRLHDTGIATFPVRDPATQRPAGGTRLGRPILLFSVASRGGRQRDHGPQASGGNRRARTRSICWGQALAGLIAPWHSA